MLIEHPDVLEAAVVGARDADGLEETVAFLVARAGTHHRRRRRSTRTAASGWPRSSGPGGSIVVDELPKTATGKIQRFAVRQRLE